MGLIVVAFLLAVAIADELKTETAQLAEVTDQQVEEHKHRSYGGYHGGYRGGYGGYRHGRSIADDVQEVALVEVADVAGAEHRYGGYRGGYGGHRGGYGGHYGGYGGYGSHRYGRSVTDDVEGQEHRYGGYRGGYGGYSRYGGYPSYGHGHGGYRGHY